MSCTCFNVKLKFSKGHIQTVILKPYAFNVYCLLKSVISTQNGIWCAL